MLRMTASLLATACLLHAGTACAEVLPSNAAASALFNQALALQAQGKGSEAFQHFRKAAEADPAASSPLSAMAMMYLDASAAAPAERAGALRKQAESVAQAALKLDERDPGALEVLRRLDDALPQQRHQPNAAALKLVHEAEVLFNDKKYAAAIPKYEQAIKLDPRYTEAVVFLGDCYFMQNDLPKAEQYFRQAAELDPQLGMAWRFLVDTLARQDKIEEARKAAIGAVAALPSALTSWGRVRQLNSNKDLPMQTFRLVRQATFRDNKIHVAPNLPQPDGSLWMAYGMAQAGAATKPDAGSPFARELQAWETTMKIAAELGSPEQIKDEGLRQLLRFYKAGELKAAVFILMYREAYRADFEAWKKADPDAIRRFINTFYVGL